MYIYERKHWPVFKWDEIFILNLLTRVSFNQGILLGKMNNLGFDFQDEALIKIMTNEIVMSCEIEGEILDQEQVRSSIAKHLGLEPYNDIRIERNVDGIVEMVLDATQNYNKPLTKKRLFGWQASLFPTGYSGIHKIRVGKFRDDKKGPMRVISGPIGKESIHYEAPGAGFINKEIDVFLRWFNTEKKINGILKAGIAHLWFLSIHPFEDGNGRIARTITDMLLAKHEQSKYRFYSLSSQIRKERNDYYKILEKNQKGTLDITEWLAWYLNCFDRAIAATEEILIIVFRKAQFRQKYSTLSLNKRQLKVLNRYLDGFIGNLTSSKWAKLAKTSQDTANRDIADLIDKKVLVSAGSGRSTHYVLAD